MLGTRQVGFIESTVRQVVAELALRGIPPEQRVMITIEPDDWISKAPQIVRSQVIARGWTDTDDR